MDPVVGGAIVGGLGDIAAAGMDMYQTNKSNEFAWEKQKKVLQNQVQWRVEDAVKAGLHPLAALGINPASGPAVSVGNAASHVSNMGANLGRAVDAMLTPEDKYAASVKLLDLQQRKANVDLTLAQLAGAQKALLTHGSTPGIASSIPADSPGKGHRLSSGGSEYWRDAAGSVHNLPPGVDASWLEDKIGESSDAVGVHRAIAGWLKDMGAKGVWPGVLGF